jgi:hypothetical protein
MSKTSFLRATVVATLLALAASVPCRAQAADTPSRVSIRIYDTASSADEQRASAIQTAAAILAEAGVSAAWFDCTGDAERPVCIQPRAERELVIRIAPTFVPTTMGTHGSIESRIDRNAAGLVLGFAVVEPSTGAGALATVFLERVLAIAQRTAVPPSALLGRAIAHEVGHLLLGTNAHSRTGLMREVWTDAELLLDRREDWLFARSERADLEPYASSSPGHTSRASMRRPRLALSPDK